MILLLTLACDGEAPPPEEPAPVTQSGGQGSNHGGSGQPGVAPTPPPSNTLMVEPTFELVGEPAEAPASIVIISLDTVRADRLGVYGGRAKTPTMSAFATEGTRFDQAISHFPETGLSHWSMLSGVLPAVHGNVPAYGGSRYSGPTLAEITGKMGYATGAFIGGITLTDRACGLSRGFDVYDDEFAVDDADMRRPAASVTNEAVAWIKQQTGPYFAFVHYFDAHFPYTPAPPWDTAYDPDYTGSLSGTDADLREYRDGGKEPDPRDLAHILALYDGELSELDAAIAPVLQAAGPDAVVVITADHGESFEHGYYFNHRAGLWDSVIRVPWLIRGPGVPRSAVVSEQVGLIDITPTVLALAGLPHDARMQGVNRIAEPTSGSGVTFAVTDPWSPEPQLARRTVDEKCIQQETGTLRYDLSSDPAEATDIGGSACDRTDYDALVASLEQYQAEAPELGRDISAEDCEKLEALGYTTCKDASGGNIGPPGQPPNHGQPVNGGNQQGGNNNTPPDNNHGGNNSPGGSQHAGNPGDRPPGLPPGTPPPKNPPK